MWRPCCGPCRVALCCRNRVLREEAHLEAAEVLLFTLISVGNEGLHGDTTAYCFDESFFNFNAIEAKDKKAALEHLEKAATLAGDKGIGPDAKKKAAELRGKK